MSPTLSIALSEGVGEVHLPLLHDEQAQAAKPMLTADDPYISAVEPLCPNELTHMATTRPIVDERRRAYGVPGAEAKQLLYFDSPLQTGRLVRECSKLLGKGGKDHTPS